jgi:acetate---CoA ligase (ADP-forming)
MTFAPKRRRIDHRLSPLLTPRSVAVVGASPREHSTGLSVIAKLDELAFDGPIYPVNPRYGEVGGHRAYPSVADLPGPPDLVIMAVGDGRIEEQFAAAIKAGARAASIFGSCVVPDDTASDLVSRLSAMAHEAGIPVNGANCMGFCNYEAAIHANSYPFPQRESGRITVLAQSGSVFGAMVGSRMKLNFAASIGGELGTTVADYMDYALELGTARVLTLFLETIRDPDAFQAALEKAEEMGVPVVALKAGRSDMAMRMAVSHSGALAGDDRAIDAVFRRHGVLRVNTHDELVATSLLMERATDVGPGELATIHDSGGEREMVVDLADEIGVPFAQINKETIARLADRLDYGLEPENPCDAFGTGYDHDGISRDCFAALMDDPATALGLYFLNVDQSNGYSTALTQACSDVASKTSKPVAIATNFSGVNHRELAEEYTNICGIPVLDGTIPALRAARHAFAWRDWRTRNRDAALEIDADRQRRWSARLNSRLPMDEAEGLSLLSDYGITVPEHAVVETEVQAIAAAAKLGSLLVMKTAMPGIAHKSDVGGVILGLDGEVAIGAAYRDLAGRLGPRVFLAPMIKGGVEVVLGVTHDPQFGPLVLLGAGGILVEVLEDVAALQVPVERWEVCQVLEGLKVRKLLAGVRGQPSADVEALVEAVVALSTLALELGENLAELDINPLLARENGVMALDAMVVAGHT